MTTSTPDPASDVVRFGVTDQGFVVKPFQAILAEAFARAQLLFGPDIDLRSSSTLRKILELNGFNDALLWMALDDVYHSGFTSTASGVALDLLGADLGLTRAHLPASGQATFKLSPSAPPGSVLTLPPGTLVETAPPDAIAFRLTAALTLSNDSAQPFPPQAGVAVTAMRPGPSGNIGANRLARINPTFAARYLSFDPGFLVVGNSAAFGGGEAFEDDGDYRRKLQAQPRTLWTPDAVRAVVFGLDGVRDALVNDPYGGLDTSAPVLGQFSFGDALFQVPRDPGNAYFFTIVVASRPGVLWQTEGTGADQVVGLRDQILAALEPIRPISTFPTIVQADTVEVAVRARLAVQSGADPIGVLAAARLALADYIASLRLGDAVLYSQVLRVLTEVAGVTDVRELRLRRTPSRFGEVVFGPPVIYANTDRIAQLEAPSGGNLTLASNEVAVFAASSSLTSLEVQGR